MPSGEGAGSRRPKLGQHTAVVDLDRDAWWWWWGGRDVNDMSLSICHHACIELRWQNAKESNSGRPRHLGLNVQEDGGRKMPHFLRRNTPPQIIQALSVTESETLNCPTRQLESCRCASTTTMKHLWHLLQPHNRDIDHHRYKQRNLFQTMGICPIATKEKSTRLSINCNCGTTLWTTARVNNLVHHLGDEEQLRSLHSFRHCHGQYLTCTQEARQPCPRTAPVEPAPPARRGHRPPC